MSLGTLPTLGNLLEVLAGVISWSLRRIEELYNAAREGTAEERAALLVQTDPELRREVELLLADPSGSEFLDRRPFRTRRNCWPIRPSPY